MSPTVAAPRGWQRAASLSLAEAAAVLEVSRTSAYAMADAGALPTTRDHLGEHRVKPADLKRLLAERRRAQGTQARLPLKGLGR